MTSPNVTEVPLSLQPVSQDTFTHAAIRTGPATVAPKLR